MVSVAAFFAPGARFLSFVTFAGSPAAAAFAVFAVLEALLVFPVGLASAFSAGLVKPGMLNAFACAGSLLTSASAMACGTKWALE